MNEIGEVVEGRAGAETAEAGVVLSFDLRHDLADTAECHRRRESVLGHAAGVEGGQDLVFEIEVAGSLIALDHTIWYTVSRKAALSWLVENFASTISLLKRLSPSMEHLIVPNGKVHVGVDEGIPVRVCVESCQGGEGHSELPLDSKQHVFCFHDVALAVRHYSVEGSGTRLGEG